MTTSNLFCLSACLLFLALRSSAADLPVPAFPGAEGAGAFAKGGRGGSVYHVTTLKDSGPGSLADAVSGSDRTIVFDVSGTIDLSYGKPAKAGKIRIAQPRITIAGQTAPGDGICIKNGNLRIAADDVIVRHLRVRPGDEMQKELDAISIESGCHNVIVDHCSAGWSVDESLSVSGTNINNITVQWCLIAESLNLSAHEKGEHGYGSLIRGDGDVTYHHNIYAHHHSRNPRPGTYGEGRGLLLDFRNNVIYDWGTRAGYSSADRVMLNYVGNYLKEGPSTTRPGEAFNIGGPTTKIFVAHNVYEGRDDLNADNRKMIGSLTAANQSVKPFAIAPLANDTAPQAFQKALADAGATRPKRDAADARVIDGIRTGGGRIINSQTEVGGWPELKSATAPADSDGDGMPDNWEKQHGLDPQDSEDGKRPGKTGYTHLENYLNALATE